MRWFPTSLMHCIPQKNTKDLYPIQVTVIGPQGRGRIGIMLTKHDSYVLEMMLLKFRH